MGRKIFNIAQILKKICWTESTPCLLSLYVVGPRAFVLRCFFKFKNKNLIQVLLILKQNCNRKVNLYIFHSKSEIFVLLIRLFPKIVTDCIKYYDNKIILINTSFLYFLKYITIMNHPD